LVGNGKKGRLPDGILEASKTGAQNPPERKFTRSKEIEMLANRLFHVLIAILLVIVVAFTVREAAATADMISRTNAGKWAKTFECTSLPSRHSIHTRSVGAMSVLYTEDGPTGIDGGLIELLSNYRACSQ
jgi:hypothetical protein